MNLQYNLTFSNCKCFKSDDEKSKIEKRKENQAFKRPF